MKRSSDITRQAVGEPVRTCVGCRSRDAQSRLVRVTVTDGLVVADPLGESTSCSRRMPGRGAYVHPRLDCVDTATRRSGLARALRTRVDSAAVTALRRVVETLSRGDVATEGRTNGH